MSPEQHIAWASVVRKQIPADQRLQVIAWPTRLWSDGDGAPMTMTQVTAYLRRIEASREEREACIIAAARERAGDDEKARRYDLKLPLWIEGFRKLVASLEPELVDRATGEALAGDPVGGLSEESVDLALKYHATSGNDDLILPFFNLYLTSEDIHTSGPQACRTPHRCPTPAEVSG